MIEAISKIRSYTAGMNFAAFAADAKTVDAVVRNLEVIGGASRRLPSSLTLLYSDTEWRRIGDMRNKLIHDYADTNVELVWQTVVTRLDSLESALHEMLARLED